MNPFFYFKIFTDESREKNFSHYPPYKLYILLICFLAFGLEDVKGQIPCTDFYFHLLSTQDEVNSFINNSYIQNCSSIYSITIGGTSPNEPSDITDLSSFANLVYLQEIFGSLTIQNNPNLTSLSGLENLERITDLIIVNNDALTDLSGLNNVETTLQSNTNVFFIIAENDNLFDISALSNRNIENVDILRIYDNPNLSICGYPNICNYISTGNEPDVYDNAVGCNDVNEITLSCMNTLSNLQVQSFYDINQNTIQDNGEPNYYDANILLIPDNLVLSQNQLNNSFFINPGSYTVSYEQETNWELTTDSISYFLPLMSGDVETVTFGLYPTQITSNLIPIITSPFTRCNDTITFDINIKNLGTTTASGTLWLEADENILATNFIDTPDTTVAPNRYGWFFSDLYPSYSLEKQIALQIPGPPDFPLGDSLVFHAYVDFEDENGINTSPTFTYASEVRCSYDPNDKLVNPTREGDYALFDEDLIYTVRFQNTGNDVAYDVVILDTLDANLDRETFRLLGSSHAERLNTSMSNNGILTFEFRDIFLPDSTSDFEGSQGYVSYLIRTIDGLAEGTPVTNSAGIYFDLNPPVITNTTQNIMVSELPSLPIEMADPLRIRLDNQTALLEWRTATETNNAGFEIQRSQDGIAWEKIGWQTGQGTITTTHRYTHRDPNPLFGTSYYRLRQVDFDGTFAYSNVVSLRYVRTEVSIYPNPVKDKLYIQTNEQPIERVLIFDATGRQIIAPLTDDTIDVSRFAKGIYMVKVTVKGEDFYEKIMVD